MGRHDWYRTPDWSEEAEADFEARLARARKHNQTQYLRIKGHALLRAGEVEAARELWMRILEYEHAFDHASALESLGELADGNDLDEAIHWFRRLVRDHPDLQATTGTGHISLAEVLLDRDRAGNADEAADLLATWAELDEPPLPSSVFRWHLAALEVAEERGQPDEVQRCARVCLDMLAAPSVSPAHPELGAVHVTPQLRARLTGLAG